MYKAVDAYDIYQAPITNYNPYIAYYFVIFIFIGSFFFLNLFIGVIFESFNEANSEESSLAAMIFPPDEYIWIEMQ